MVSQKNKHLHVFHNWCGWTETLPLFCLQINVNNSHTLLEIVNHVNTQIYTSSQKIHYYIKPSNKVVSGFGTHYQAMSDASAHLHLCVIVVHGIGELSFRTLLNTMTSGLLSKANKTFQKAIPRNAVVDNSHIICKDKKRVRNRWKIL